MKNKTKLIGLLILSMAAASAQNVVILGDATLWGGHSDGGVFIRGSVSGSSYETTGKTLDSRDSQDFIGGDQGLTRFWRQRGGGQGARVAGLWGNTEASQVPVAEPNWGTYVGLSLYWAAQDSSPFNPEDNGNNLRLRLDESQELYVFDLDPGYLAQYRTLDFQGNANATVVFNVAGDVEAFRWTVNHDPANVIWNFLDAETVWVQDRNLRGHLLAPNAHLVQSQNIDGFLLAKSWENHNSAEVHFFGLPVPEPAMPVLLLSAIVSTLARRRR